MGCWNLTPAPPLTPFSQTGRKVAGMSDSLRSGPADASQGSGTLPEPSVSPVLPCVEGAPALAYLAEQVMSTGRPGVSKASGGRGR